MAIGWSTSLTYYKRWMNPARLDKKEIYKHVGDFSLFILGLFPESLSRGKRCISLELLRRSGQTLVYDSFGNEQPPTSLRHFPQAFRTI